MASETWEKDMAARISIELPVARDRVEVKSEGSLVTLVPLLLVCAAFAYFAYVLLMG